MTSTFSGNANTASFRELVANRSRRHEIFTTPDGVRISAREWGDPAGPPILFVHGVAQSHLAFARQYASPELAKFRLVALDVRGHGESDKPDDIAFYQDHRRWGSDIHVVIEGLKLDRPLLAGWSMGGRVIGQYLSSHGAQAISGLHLISTRVVVDGRFGGPGPAIPLMTGEPGLAGDIAAAMAFVRACFHRQPEPDDFAAMLAYNIIAWPRLKFLQTAWAPRVEETLVMLRALRVPTLITHGTRDALILQGAGEYLHELIPHSTISIYEDCGHSPFWEMTERFNREFAAFARGVFGL